MNDLYLVVLFGPGHEVVDGGLVEDLAHGHELAGVDDLPQGYAPGFDRVIGQFGLQQMVAAA